MGLINFAGSDVLHAALCLSQARRRIFCGHLLLGCCVVYCSMIRHHGAAVILHGHFCKYNSVRSTFPGGYSAHPLLAKNMPPTVFGALSVGDLVLTGPETPA